MGHAADRSWPTDDCGCRGFLQAPAAATVAEPQSNQKWDAFGDEPVPNLAQHAASCQAVFSHCVVQAVGCMASNDMLELPIGPRARAGGKPEVGCL